MTAVPPADDLAERLKGSFTPGERAAALGIDYDALVAADRRLLIGTFVVDLVLAVPAAVVIAVVAILSGNDLAGLASLQLPGALFGLLVGLGVAIVPLLALNALLTLRGVKSLSMRMRSSLGNGVLAALSVLALAAAMTLVPVGWWLGVAMAFAVGKPLFELVGVRQLPVLIRGNHPLLADVHAQLKELPASGTLLDYRARWLIASQAISTLGAIAVALLLFFSLWLTLPLVAIRVVVAIAAERKWWQAGPMPSLVLSGIEATALLVAGITVFAITH